MGTAHLAHGFNVYDNGAGTTDLLCPHLGLIGYDCLQHDYGWLGLIGVRVRNRYIAEDIAKVAQVGDIAAGHSNGGTISAMAADDGAPLRGLVLINPALPNDRVFAPQLEWIHIYYSTGDLAVGAAVALQALPWNWPIFHRGKTHQWGDMGCVGYTGDDPRVCAFRTGSGRHSAIFGNLDKWGPIIAANVEKGLGAKIDGPQYTLPRQVMAADSFRADG